MKNCGEYGITINTEAYRSGWAQGARQYCTPASNLGYQDGQAGIPKDNIISRIMICDEAGVRLNLRKYEQGWRSGIADFCTYEHGVNLAKMGKPLPEVCPASLQAKFQAGWMSGKKQFCNQTENAFALGKANQPYPSLCTPELYIAFKSEYDRGHAIAERMGQFQDKQRSLEEEISHEVNHFGFNPIYGGYFELGEDKSEDAKRALHRINMLVREKQAMEREYFNLQVMR